MHGQEGDQTIVLTAKEVAVAFLAGAVEATIRPSLPAPCLSVRGSLAAGESGAVARDALIAWREDGGSRLRRRFEQAADDGDLPPEADPELLARYLMTVSHGIAVQAAGGALRSELHCVAPLREKLAHLRACLHGVNHELVAAVEDEHDCLEEATARVEADPKLPRGAVVVKVLDP